MDIFAVGISYFTNKIPFPWKILLVKGSWVAWVT
jgi:hypothetical protein